MTTFIFAGLAVAVVLVPLACAGLIVERLARRKRRSGPPPLKT